MKAILSWVVTPALTLAVGMSLASSFHLDIEDHSGEWAASEQTKVSATELRRDLAGARICREAHGESGFTWNYEGQLVCIPRRGKPVVEQ